MILPWSELNRTQIGQIGNWITRVINCESWVEFTAIKHVSFKQGTTKQGRAECEIERVKTFEGLIARSLVAVFKK